MADAGSLMHLAAQAVYEFARLDQSQVLTFPRGEPDAVTITDCDIESLQPKKFLRDNIIDFYIKYLQTKLPPGVKDHSYFFNSFFSRIFLENSGASTDNDQSKAAYERVRKWTHEVNLFEKEYIFIPVIRSSHWSLIFICHLDSLTRSPEEHKASPCIFHLDSVGGNHESFEAQLRRYILEAWSERYQVANRDQLLALCQLKYVQAEVPQQDNEYDCGIYLLHYVESLLDEASQDFSQGSLHFSGWKSSDIVAKRWNIECLIGELSGMSQLQLRLRIKSHEILSWLKGLDNGQHGVELEHVKYGVTNETAWDNQLGSVDINHAKGTKTEEIALDHYHQHGVQIEHAECQKTDEIVLNDHHQCGIVIEDAEYQTTGEIVLYNEEHEQLPCTKLAKSLKRKRGRGRNWTKEQTSVLLDCKVKACFQKGNEAGTCWNMISQEIREKVGTMLTGDQCRLRYDTLLKAYKIVMDYCVKTGKSFSEITEEERIKLRLATILHEDWFMAIDKICHCSPHKAKSHKRVKSTPSVVHGQRPVRSARPLQEFLFPTSIFPTDSEQDFSSSLIQDPSLCQGEWRDKNSALESKVQAEVEQSITLKVSEEVSSPGEQCETTDTTQILSAGVIFDFFDGAREALSAPTTRQYGSPDSMFLSQCSFQLYNLFTD